MTDKDALELLNMFTAAYKIAKSRNKFEFKLNMQEATLSELLKQAFPYLKDEINRRNIAGSILNN